MKYKMPATLSALCRKKIFDKLLEEYSGDTYLELGVGYHAGMIDIMSKHGFTNGLGIDFSEKAIKRSNLIQKKYFPESNFSFKVDDIYNLNQSFDYVLMFEVLEHIPDDISALKKVYELLNKDGYFIMSVPARMKLWTYSDDFVGHIRRYEKAELKNKLKDAGFEVKDFFSYGFPLLLLSNRVGSLILKKRNTKKNSQKEKTKSSSNVPVKRFKNNFFINLFLIFQYKIGRYIDWGTGYMVLCKKV